MTVKPVCRHWAVFNALTYYDLTGKETRIIVYPTSAIKMHAEAQALEPDGWYSLKWDGERVIAFRKEMDNPPRFYTLKDYMHRLSNYGK